MTRALLVAVLLAVLAPGVARAQTIEEQQWHLDELGVRQAHGISRGDGVLVAVVDSGVDDTRPDLAGQVLPGTGFGSAAGTDGTEDQDGHGTAMAALIAGRAVDGGALGIAPGAKVLPVSVGADGENFTLEAVSQGIRWAVDRGAKVINLSLTSVATLTPELLRAVNYAFDHDVVVVAGTGNAGERHVGAPANIRGVVAVSGTVPGGGVWPDSNTGPETVLAAPAREIVTAVPVAVSGSGYAAVDGTSAATALVSGVAALVRAAHPELDAGNVVNRLITGAKDLLDRGRDDATGFGLVDPVGALTTTAARVDRNPLAPPPRTTAPAATSPAQAPAPPVAAAPALPGAGTRAAVALGGLALVLLAVLTTALLLARATRPRHAPPPVTTLPPPSDDFWRPTPP